MQENTIYDLVSVGALQSEDSAAVCLRRFGCGQDDESAPQQGVRRVAGLSENALDEGWG